ncbi:hypothetical protein [Mesorhizobium sp.]|uniref:hypothetical protein n=1 Tax=Mesorhizobium sp. TaxID=1871066 RepID=UPI000FE615BB|nr:hypothetical protein [Mesorhizobium sp.]RWD79107.1 MAG: hypothetical protein EOS48_22190 [Mesorhizobium sp.]
MTAVNTVNRAYTRAHTAIFTADKLRNLMKSLVIDAGLDPKALMDAWSGWVYNAARKLMESGHLRTIVIEFYKPGSTIASGRWDFPIRYDANGVDDMWVDSTFFKSTFAKAPRPPAGCIYRVILVYDAGAPDVGLYDVSFLSLNGLTRREAGTVIATPDIMASAAYYR